MRARRARRDRAGDPRSRTRRTIFLTIAVVVAALGLTLHATKAVTALGLWSVDERFALRGEQPVPDDLAIVAIDDVTFGLLEQFPFPRSLHAKVIDRLRADGAKVIAYDVVFAEPTEPDEDGALLDALAEASGRVVLSATETDDAGRPNVLGGQETLDSVGAVAGSTQLDADASDTLRRVPYETGGLKSFAVVAAELATGRPVGPGRFTEPRRNAWIDYAGGPGHIKTVPFGLVAQGKFRRGTFRDRIVVVGATATSLQDIHPTSTTNDRERMAGPEIQANAIKTVLDGLPLQSAPAWSDWVLIVLAAAVVPLAMLRLRFRAVLLLALALGAGYLAVSVGAFGVDLVLPIAVPLLSLALATVASTAAYALLTAVERQRTRDLFARFVPEAVVDDVLAKADGDLRLGGQRKEGTVMFCDLRGFTTFAERLEPSRVIDVLNHYLSEMSDAIMEREGTLVAYMGDGIMAVFGAPLDRVDHADRAVAAAREMVSVRLPRFNAWLRAEGLADEDFRMGIGVNSGPVMSGNVGSSTRVEYTAIGDTTNTAARIEGMTKDEGTQVLLSEATRAALVQGETLATLDEIGERSVRGRDQTIRLWTLRL